METRRVYPVLAVLIVGILTLAWVYANNGIGLHYTVIPSPRRLNHVNRPVMSYDRELRRRFDALLARNASFNDPGVLEVIRAMLDPPSRHIVKQSKNILHTPQSRRVSALLKDKTGGFFVECGALDGDANSNTLYLEQKRGWTGLLIEVDPYYYTQLLGKSRNAWSINACIKQSYGPTEMDFIEASGQVGSLIRTKELSSTNPIVKVPCFPLRSILLALNVTHVDYFSLDVEGLELSILQSVNFTDLDVSVWSVECMHGKPGNEEKMIEHMINNNYTLNTKMSIHVYNPFTHVEDLIFVNKNCRQSSPIKSRFVH